jgi:YD repeat-containing protein
MNQGRVSVGHPVDVGSGAVFTLSTDFRIPGSLELRWQRSYSTDATCHTWLGPKWTVPYFMSLERRPDRYILRGAHGEEVIFPAPTGPLRVGVQLVHLSAKMELRRESDQYSVLHWHTGGQTIRFCFQLRGDQRMLLTAFANMAGNRVRVEYDLKHRPVRLVQELENRTVEIMYGPTDLIHEIHFLSKSGRKALVRYEYDDNQRLVEARDALGHRKGYEYDQENRIVAETNPLGARFVFAYDRLGRCVHTSGSDGYMERKLQYHTMPPMTRVTNSRGAVTEYYLNPIGQVLQIVEPGGKVTNNTFDKHNRLVEVIRPDGTKESYGYDAQGNRTTTVDPCGAKTTVEYDENHMPTRMVDRNGTAWRLDNQ